MHFRHWANQNPHWVIESNHRQINQVMVWAGVIDHQIIGPYFYDENVTAESYLKMLGDFVIPEILLLNYDPQHIWFQQDGAAPHYANIVKQFCNENFHGWIGRGGTINWPARSPDQTPLDFFVWPYAKNLVYQEPRPTTIPELKEKIRNVMQSITPAMLRNVKNNITKRIFKCIEVGGNHITNQTL